MVINKERFTKHYYSGTQRVASKLGVGDFNNLFIQGSTHIPEKLSGWSLANKRFTYLHPDLENVVSDKIGS